MIRSAIVLDSKCEEIVNNNSKVGDSFRYLGRYFDFAMSNDVHKRELIAILTDSLSQIDRLPLHPKNKLKLYNQYLLSKISWHLTVADISATWIKEKLDSVAAKYIRKCLIYQFVPPSVALFFPVISLV